MQWLLAHETYDKAVIFTNTREQADCLGGVLRATSHKVFVLHGEKDQKECKPAMDQFKDGGVCIPAHRCGGPRYSCGRAGSGH